LCADIGRDSREPHADLKMVPGLLVSQ
jgi:hypothetical protein